MLAPFKYAGYPMLLQAVALPRPDTAFPEAGSQHFLAAERTPQLQVRLAPMLGIPSNPVHAASAQDKRVAIPDPGIAERHWLLCKVNSCGKHW